MLPDPFIFNGFLTVQWLIIESYVDRHNTTLLNECKAHLPDFEHPPAHC